MIVDMDIVEPWRDVDNLLKQLAAHAMDKHLYRRGNDFWEFSPDLVTKINSSFIGPKRKSKELVGGYLFLDEDSDEQSGMIRLCYSRSNPKWSFWYENDEVHVCDA